MKKIGLMLLLVLIMVGCAGKTVLLKNEKGEIAKCEVSAADVRATGIYGRDKTIDNCVNAYIDAGYHRITKEKN